MEREQETRCVARPRYAPGGKKYRRQYGDMEREQKEWCQLLQRYYAKCDTLPAHRAAKRHGCIDTREG
jgi:hypothetical protein